MSNVARIAYRPSGLVMAAVAAVLAASGSREARSAEEEEVQELAEVVVTGSRIARRDYESQSPIVTVQSETFEDRSAIGIEATLQQLPQFAPSANAQANSGASNPFPSANASPGAATSNLRGLGTNRNLVLVDGRRVQPVNGNLLVDLNTIPSAAIQSVEVITGGAAAVYGADAISGVVNLILKKNFQGAQFDAQYGITEEGDGVQYQVSALLGANYSDGRGNVMFGGNYAKRGDAAGKDRAWVRKGWEDPGTPAGAVPGASPLSLFRCARGPGGSAGNCPGSLWLPINNGNGYVIDQNGNVFDPNQPLNAGHPYTGPLGGDSGFKINPNGSLGYFDRETSWISVPLERYSLLATTNYDLNDRVELFSEARFTQSFTIGRGTHVGLFNIWSMKVPYNAALDDPDSPTFGQGPVGTNRHPVSRPLADLLNACQPACLNQTIVDLNPATPDITGAWQYEGGVDYLPPYRTDTTTNTFQLIAGARGDMEIKDWTWEIYGSHGATNVNSHLPESFLSEKNMQSLFTHNLYGVGWRNPEALTVAGTCTSGLPIFNADGSVNSASSVSQDCADWGTLRMNNVMDISQEVLEANMQGTMFDGWAGPWQFALGGDYRSEKYKFAPDAAYGALQETANVVNNIGLPVGVNGLNHVTEGYIELNIPLLADIPFIKKLEIGPGYRISDYKNGGTIDTWKVTGTWQMFDAVSLRGGFQHANRAPNMNELFLPVGAASIQGALDACGNWPTTPVWGNVAANPNRQNLQILCQELMVRDGAPPSLYVPGSAAANGYNYTVFGPALTAFPFNLGITGGNEDLESEKADTITAGIVLRSPFLENDYLRRLSLSADYYDIDLEGAIGVPSGSQVYQQCFDPQYNPLIGDAAGSHTGAELAAANPYCDLIRREYVPGVFEFGADRRYDAKYVNLGGIQTSGYDIQLDWAAPLGSGPSQISLNVQFNDLLHFKQSPFPGGAFTERAGTWDAGFNYDWQIFSTLGYSAGPYSVGLRWQHRPGLNPPSSAGVGTQPTKSYTLMDLFGRVSVNEQFELRAGIDNLLDRDPNRMGVIIVPGNAAASNNAYGSAVGGQDTFGRRYYVALNYTL